MATALSVCGIALIWAWSLLGRKAFRAHTGGRLFAHRQAAATQPFAILLALALAGYAATSPVLAAALGVASSAAYMRYVALDPLRTGFWHHRRLRLVGIAVLAAVGALIGLYAPAAAFAPLATAALVFSRYLRLSVAMTEQHLTDLDAQRQKLLFEAARAAARASDKVVDKAAKAG